MKKQELLEAMKEAIKTEESAITLYLKHMDAFCNRFDIDEKYIKKVKEYIEILNEGNRKHKKMCEDTYNKILKDKRNDY